ncbi:YihY/virulence factor BrkB family protein [Alkalicoccus luteus]|uniref:YihY/virulence factor BrkB family protein n=1 Tax=Alkalicoccus luteus TaxID=1237094 RepID=UPI004033449C
MKEFWRRFQDHQLINLGAQCAYFLLLSLFPFLLVVIAFLSYLPFRPSDVFLLLQNAYVPPGALEVVESQWNVLTADTQPALLSVGALLTLWTASLALNSIISSLNLAYNTTETRPFLKERGIALLLTIAMFFVIIAALVLQVVGVHIRDWLQLELMLFNMDLVRWSLTSLMLFAVFMLLYWTGPSRMLRFRDVYIGALTATVGWQVASYFFSAFVSRFADFSATYGTIGAVIALMVWFHLISLILLIGGEINAMRKEKNFEKEAG